MYILGIGGSNHDYSTCIAKDDHILCMIEDERITRNKHSKNMGISLAQGFSRKYCLDDQGLSYKDIDLIVANDIIHPAALFRLDDVKLINHHLSHAASAFYCSPFEEAAILIVDSVGSKIQKGDECLYESITYAYGSGNRIEILDQNLGRNLPGTDYIENSLGIFYTILTELAGFKELQEGKTMGLAPYGTNRVYQQIKSAVEYIGQGKVEMTEDSIWKLISYKEQIAGIPDVHQRFCIMADYAFAAQQVLEEILLNVVNHLQLITKSKNLCFAGGTALNSVANYKIYKSGIFANMFLQPAAGDNGTSIGAALYGYHQILGGKRVVAS